MRAWWVATVVLVGGCNQILGGEITGSDRVDDAGTDPGADGGDIGADSATPTRDGGMADACTGSAAWSTPLVVGGPVDVLVGESDGISIAVSASGDVHVAYDSGLDTIYRQRAASGSWDAAVTWSGITSGLVGVDGANVLHVFFGENSYTYRPPGGAWSTAVSGTPYVWCRAFAIGPSGPLVSAFWNRFEWGAPGGAWSTVQPSIGGACQDPSIALPANGDIHFLARGYSSGDQLVHAVRTNDTWTTSVIDSGAAAQIDDSSFAVDSTGTAHVVFSKGSAGDRKLTYRKRAPGATASPYVQPEQGVIVADVAAVIDATDTLHVLYHDMTDENLRYLQRSSTGAWSDPDVVGAPGTGGGRVKLAIDGTGRIHAIWTDEQNRLIYASRCTSS